MGREPERAGTAIGHRYRTWVASTTVELLASDKPSKRAMSVSQCCLWTEGDVKGQMMKMPEILEPPFFAKQKDGQYLR
jgi:hypothetical protein